MSGRTCICICVCSVCAGVCMYICTCFCVSEYSCVAGVPCNTSQGSCYNRQGIGFREMMCHAWRCSKKRNRCDVMIEEEEGRGGKKSKAKEKK